MSSFAFDAIQQWKHTHSPDFFGAMAPPHPATCCTCTTAGEGGRALGVAGGGTITTLGTTPCEDLP